MIISNSLFDQCEAFSGGGIYADIFNSGKLTIDGQCNFTYCYAFIGGGISATISGITSQLVLDDEIIFEGCYAAYNEPRTGGGGIFIYFSEQGSMIVNNVLFNYCETQNSGGGIYFEWIGNTQMKLIFNVTQFTNCQAYQGGGIYAAIQSENSILELIGVKFENCKALEQFGGGGIYSYISQGSKLSIKDQCIFTICKTTQGSGGGFCSNIIDGTLNIENTTFDRCTCTQPGNGGGIYLIQGISSIISITNSSFIDCKSILNSSDQRYGWGGAIFIQTSVIAENLNETNFLMKYLVFIGCSAINSIGNNLHIQSVDTHAIGLVIKNEILLTVIDQSNPPNIISDLYTSPSYAYDYMGINQSIETSNRGTINLNLHNPLFEQFFISYVPNPTYIDSINGKDIKFCGGL
ncbi:MAG: hypothetical protein EZS28_040285 [Streblomastix strix]|uniref:Right handed beta helix domain-containing protein n=1 Tax=Streblomastix strix TaxID=222440 RepID=A0A5J4U1F6_9EUKA|nr:MAG: hypothetical protein EZS28_040285 [Streblomastix strix]